MSGVDGEDRLAAEQILGSLGQVRLGHKIVVVEEAGSTNDLAWAAAEGGTAEGFVIFAERQTAGRGQYGRNWNSASQRGLWFSVLLRPKISVADSPHLTALLAQVVAATIDEELGCEATLKWPNDIYVGGRKVAGVLVEGRTDSAGNYIAIAGIGLNVNQTIEEFPTELQATAGSLAMMVGRHIDRMPLAVALLARLDAAYARFARP